MSVCDNCKVKEKGFVPGEPDPCSSCVRLDHEGEILKQSPPLKVEGNYYLWLDKANGD